MRVHIPAVPDSGNLKFELLQPSHNRKAFSCGEPALDRYLKELASQDQARRSAAIYILANGTEIVGYYSLSASAVPKSLLAPELLKKMPRYETLPFYILGRLAVDQRYKGRGFGTVLLKDALLRSLAQTKHVGAVGVVVDALNENANQFYRRHQFTELPNMSNRLVISMDRIRQAYALSNG